MAKDDWVWKRESLSSSVDPFQPSNKFKNLMHIFVLVERLKFERDVKNSFPNLKSIKTLDVKKIPNKNRLPCLINALKNSEEAKIADCFSLIAKIDSKDQKIYPWCPLIDSSGLWHDEAKHALTGLDFRKYIVLLIGIDPSLI